MSNLLHRIAEYFKEWDGQEPAPTMQVNIDDLRYIASMHTDNCSLRERLQRENNNDGWIPVSERLPKEKGWYQCSCYSPERWIKGMVRDLYWNPTSQQFVDNIRYSTNGFDDIKKYYWTEWVIAWQPLPQPYKESE